MHMKGAKPNSKKRKKASKINKCKETTVSEKITSKVVLFPDASCIHAYIDISYL